jgi:iron complex outermembrane receptor protein
MRDREQMAAGRSCDAGRRGQASRVPELARSRYSGAGSAVAGAVAAILCGAAHATEANSPGAERLEEVTVSGSRVARRDFVAPTPVTSLSAEDLETRGTTNINTTLRQLPSTNSVNAFSTQGASVSGLGGVDLRGFGSNRTLVLVNGRRQVPSTDSGVVDTNTIPAVALSRVEVVTGGASAAWGSDAIAGVTNIIYNTRFEGAKLDAQVGASGHGDAREFRFAFAGGTAFAEERGHVMVAAEWNKIDDLVTQGDRDWGRKNFGVIRNTADTGPTDGRPRLLISPDIRISNATLGGVITSPGALSNIAFGPGGALIPFATGTNTATPITIGGTNTDLAASPSLSVPYERKSLLAAVEYRLTDGVNAFFEAQYSAADTTNPIAFNWNFGNLTIAGDNPFISPQLRARMTAANVTSFNIGRLHSELGPYQANNSRDVLSTTIGIKGEFGAGFTWDAYVQRGESRFDSYQTGNRYNANFAYAIDAVTSPTTGQPVCRVSLNPAVLPAALQQIARDCRPFNPFGQGSPSAASIEYVSAVSSFDRQQTQDVVSANIAGDLAELWAGPLSIAAGVEYREESVAQQIDPGSQGNLLALSNGRPANGGFDVTDVYVEGALPLAKDVPFFKSLEINAAYRHSEYSTVGGVDTWKAGLTWRPVESVLVRGSLSRDIRAPNTSELFVPGIASTFTPQDPCFTTSQASNPAVRANCAAAGIPPVFAATLGSITAFQVGNLELRPEESDTTSFGLVISPEALPSFQASFDWFRIKLDGAIGVLPAQTLLDSCYVGGVAAACSTVTRDPVSRALSRIDRKFINVGTVDAEGLDFQLGYAYQPGEGARWADRLSLRMIGTYLYKKEESVDGFRKFDIAGQVDPTIQAINPGVPKLRWNLLIDYELGEFALRPQVRYIGSANFNNSYTAEDINDNSIGAVVYLDVTADYRLDLGGRDTTVYVGVNNLADKDPPAAPGGIAFIPVHTNSRLYDVVGRAFFAGIRMTF